MPELICKILHIGKTTYYKYLKDNVPIVLFLNSLKKEELEEFLETGQIEKFEKIKNFDLQKNKILDNFFYEYYSRKPINRNFSNDIFPKFEKYVEIEVEKRREKLNENVNTKTISKIKYFNKYDFFEFLLKMEIEEAQKIDIIQTISELKEIEFFLIMSEFENFLNKN